MSSPLRPRPHTHSVMIDGHLHTWEVPRLWALAEGLPTFEYEVRRFAGFDDVMWFGDGHPPTVRAVLDHVHRVQTADLSRPILLSEVGRVMDGVHRLCRALIEGRDTVTAVRFVPTPAADRVEVGRRR
jgi:hypothetical protein